MQPHLMYGIVDPAIKWTAPNVRYQVCGVRWVEYEVAYETFILKIVINQRIEGRVWTCKTHVCNLKERISKFPSVSFFLYFSLFLNLFLSLSSCSPNFLSLFLSFSLCFSLNLFLLHGAYPSKLLIRTMEQKKIER